MDGLVEFYCTVLMFYIFNGDDGLGDEDSMNLGELVAQLQHALENQLEVVVSRKRALAWLVQHGRDEVGLYEWQAELLGHVNDVDEALNRVVHVWMGHITRRTPVRIEKWGTI